MKEPLVWIQSPGILLVSIPILRGATTRDNLKDRHIVSPEFHPIHLKRLFLKRTQS